MATSKAQGHASASITFPRDKQWEPARERERERERERLMTPERKALSEKVKNKKRPNRHKTITLNIRKTLKDVQVGLITYWAITLR